MAFLHGKRLSFSDDIFTLHVLTNDLWIHFVKLNKVTASITYRVSLNSCVDEIQTLLDFRGDRRRGGDVVALHSEAELVSGVLDGDDLSVRGSVAVRALLHESVLVLSKRL